MGRGGIEEDDVSAPAGWHLQPDGRERYWDGQQWTEDFRRPLASDPTAPPDWASTSQDTQADDLSQTTALPAAAPVADAPTAATPYAAPDPYATAQPGAGPPRSGYPASGPPPAQRRSGALTGCLIAAVAGVLVLALLVGGAIFFFVRTVDEVSDSFPTSFPSGFPSDLPSDFPTTLPTDGPGSLNIEVTVGVAFDLPGARIEDGWSVQGDGAGALDLMRITGMRAVLTEDAGLPVLFTVAFEVDDGTSIETVCTAPSASAGESVEVSCVPLVGNVENARRVSVTSVL